MKENIINNTITLKELRASKLKEMKEQLKDRRLYIVAEVTGLSYPTIKKIADGVQGKYDENTIDKLSDYLNK